MAANVGANVATSKKRATKLTSESPAPRPKTAVTMGRPAATNEPNASSMMTIATTMPMASLFGGSWPANASTEPLAPTVTPSWPLAVSTFSIMVCAV